MSQIDSELDKNIILEGLQEAQQNGTDALSSYLKDLIVIFEDYKLKLAYEIVEEFLHLGVLSLENGLMSLAQECICLFHYSVNNCDNLQDKIDEIFFTYLNRLIAKHIEEKENKEGDLLSFHTDLFVCISNLQMKSYFLTLWNNYPDNLCSFAHSNLRLISDHVCLFNEDECYMCVNPPSGHIILQRHSSRMKLIVTSCEFLKCLFDQCSQTIGQMISNEKHIHILLIQYEQLSDMEVRKILLTLFKSMWTYLNKQKDPDPQFLTALRPIQRKQSYSLGLTKTDNIHIDHLKKHKYIYLKNCTMDVNTFDDVVINDKVLCEENSTSLSGNSITTDSNRGSLLINIFCLHFYNIRNELLFIVPYDTMCMKKTANSRTIVFHFQKETAAEVLSDKLNICNNHSLRENAQVSIGFSNDSIKNKIEETIVELIKISNKISEVQNQQVTSFESLTSTSYESSEQISSNDQINSCEPSSEEPESNGNPGVVVVPEESMKNEIPKAENIKKKKVTFAQSNKIPIMHIQEETEGRTINLNESVYQYQYLENSLLREGEEAWKATKSSDQGNQEEVEQQNTEYTIKTNRSCLKNSDVVQAKIGVACTKISNEDYTSSMSIQGRVQDSQSNTTTILMDSHDEQHNNMGSPFSMHHTAFDKSRNEEFSSDIAAEPKEPLFKMRLIDEIEKKLETHPGVTNKLKCSDENYNINSIHDNNKKNASKSLRNSIYSTHETDSTPFSKNYSNTKGNPMDQLNITTTKIVRTLLNAEQTEKNMNECLDYMNSYISSVESKNRSTYSASIQNESSKIYNEENQRNEENEEERLHYTCPDVLQANDTNEILCDSMYYKISENVPSSKIHTPRAVTQNALCEVEIPKKTEILKGVCEREENVIADSFMQTKEWNQRSNKKKRMSSNTLQGTRTDSSTKRMIDSPYPIKRSRNHDDDDLELWNILKPHKTTENELGKYLIMVWAIIEYHKRTTHLKIEDDFKSVRYEVISSFDEINNRYKTLKRKLQEEYDKKYHNILTKYVDRLISKKKKLNMHIPEVIDINLIIQKIKELQKTYYVIQRTTEDKISDSHIQVQYKQSDLYSPPFSITTLMSKHST